MFVKCEYNRTARTRNILLLGGAYFILGLPIGVGFAGQVSENKTLASDSVDLGCNDSASLQEGSYALADGNAARALGHFTTAVGGCSHALAQGASAFGYNSQANAVNSSAFGANAKADSVGGLALGSGASVSTDSYNAIAIGTGSNASNPGSVALGAGSQTSAAVATSGTKLNGVDYNFAGSAPDSTVSIGAKGKERTLTNLAAGRIGKDSTDAVNGSELYATNQAVTTVNNQFKTFGSGLASLLGGGSTFNSDGSIGAPTYNIGGREYHNIGDTFGAVNHRLDNLSDRMAGFEDVSKRSVKYDPNPDGTNSNSITPVGGDPNSPVAIHNISDGSADLDVTNVRQLKKVAEDAHSYADIKSTETLKDAKSYTDNVLKDMDHRMDDKLSMLSGRVDNVEKEARQAAAIGLAASSLRYDDRPGKLSAAIGGGAWRGEGAFAAGLGYTSENQRIRLNVAATNAGHHWGMGGGVSYTFN